MSELATGAIGAVASILTLIYSTLQIIDTIRQGPEFLNPTRARLVRLSQRLSKLQNASLNRTLFERLAWTPYNDSTMIALEKDIESVRRLASRYRWDKCRSSYAFEDLSLMSDKEQVKRLEKRLEIYLTQLRNWDQQDRTIDQSFLSAGDKRYLTPTDKTPAGLMEDDRFRVLQWLSSIDPRARYRELQTNQDSNIGNDFMEQHFMSWHQTSSSNVLWIHGKPGTGKTHISARVIRDLCRDNPTRNPRVAYAYCDPRQHHTFTDIAASLVRQLLATNKQLPQLAFDIYHERHALENPSLPDLLRLYLEVATLSHRVDIVIDGFDDLRACTKNEVLAISRILEHSSTKAIIFSRKPIPRKFHRHSSVRYEEIELIPPSKDILQALRNKLVPARFPELPQGLEDALKVLAETAGGSFVTPMCHLREVMKRSLTLADILHELNSTEANLDEVLSEMIESVCEQSDSRLRKFAIHTLKWLCQAKRPLTANEICEAYAIEESQIVLNNANVPKPDSIKQSCQGLVVIEDPLHTVNLTHSAMWLPLFSKMRQKSLLDPAFTTESCLRYLKLASALIPEWDSIKESTHPFLAYAEANWMLHLQEFHAASNKSQTKKKVILDLTMSVLQGPLLVDFKAESPRSDARSWHGMTASLNDTRDISGLHVCARFDLAEEAQKILQNTKSSEGTQDTKVTPSTTPFHEAARTNSQSVASLLLKSSKVNCERLDTDGRSALHYAAYYGQFDFIKKFWTLAHWKADCQDNEGKTPLMLAAQLGHVDIIRVLLEKNASLHLCDQSGNTALHFACLNGQFEVAKQLLAHGAPVTDTNSEGFTPLHSAVLGRSPELIAELIRLLLMMGGSTVSEANDGSNPLHLAARKAEGLIVTRLLDQGADADAIDMKGWTPTIVAAHYDNEDAIRALIEAGADVDYFSKPEKRDQSPGENQDQTVDGFGSVSPLIVACAEGHLNIVQTLLNHGADPNLRNTNGESAIFAAARSGKVDLVKMLIGFGADVNSTSYRGFTPIEVASQGRHYDVVQLLKSNGADARVLENNERWKYDDSTKSIKSTSVDAEFLGGAGSIFQSIPYIEVNDLRTTESAYLNQGGLRHGSKRLRIDTPY